MRPHLPVTTVEPDRTRRPCPARALRPDRADPGRLAVDASPDPQAILLQGHGAGGGTEAFDLVALAFPLHLPGRPERSRADELAGFVLGCAGRAVGAGGRAG